MTIPPCGIAPMINRAERAWRAELAATTIADPVEAVRCQDCHPGD